MARQVASYNLLAIPVVDEENKLVGVITVDDVIDVIKDEATEDLYRLAGVSGDERVATPAFEALRKRLPWLGVNLVTAFLAASVVALFEGTIQQVTALAVFMPIVAGMGGNAATQTLTVIVRGLALGELSWGNARKALLKEAVDRPRQRRRARAWSRPLRGLGDQGRPDARPAAGHGDGHQHVRRGDGRHAGAAGPEGAEDRSGAGLVGVHHHVHRRGRVRLVPGPGDDLPEVSGAGIVTTDRMTATASVPLYTADALVLRTYKLGEADRIVVFLTRDRGKKRGVAQQRAAAAHRGSPARSSR